MEFRNVLNFVLSSFIIYVLVAAVPCLYDIFVAFSITIVGIKLAEWLMTSTRKWFLYKTVCPTGKAVLITGCDSGFGNKLAKRMDRLGYKVFASCLYPNGGGAKELQSSCSHNLCVIPMDVTDNRSIEKAKEIIAGNLDSRVLWAVVNNAGVPQAGEIDWTPLEELQKVHDVNAAGTLRVTKAFLPFVKRAKGRIVNMTSICGHFICPGYVGYCMSKSAAVSMTTGLRMELFKWGVKAISIEPFFYSTPLTQTEATWDLVEKTWLKAPVEIREEYGEHYKEFFKKNVANLLARCNPNINEVIDCLEDAITAEEPLPSYFPSSSYDKFGIKLLTSLPSTFMEWYQRGYLDRGVQPALLMQNKRKG